MKEAEFHQLAGKRAQSDQGDLFRVDAMGLDLGDLVHFDAVDVFHHQDRPGRVIPVHPGDHDFIGCSEIGGEFFHATGFDKHVEFLEDRPLELLDQVCCAHHAGQIGGFFDLFRKIVHQADVFADFLLDARPHNLDRHFLAVDKRLLQQKGEVCV